MIGRTLVMGAAVIGAAFVLTPRDGEEGGPWRAGTSQDSVSDEYGDNGGDWYAGEFRLDREGDGHFYADGIIDGASVRFLVDTGASVVALTAEDARAAGLDWSDDEVRRIGTGASGAVYGVPARIPSLEVGGRMRSNVDAVIIPEGLEISLLGQSYLSQIGSVEISGNAMVFGG